MPTRGRVLPRRQRRGPIEAHEPPKTPSILPSFRVGNDAAPLKPRMSGDRLAEAAAFRVGNDAAPLKRRLVAHGRYHPWRPSASATTRPH